MSHATDIILISLALGNLFLLVTSRVRACIKIVAFQGIFLGLIPLFSYTDSFIVTAFLIAAVSVALKGFIFPMMLLRIMRSTNARREVEPLVGYTASLLIGVALFIVSFWLSSKVPLADATRSPLALPVALSTILMGLFFIVSRKKAINQVLGYIVLENGIFAFGFALGIEAGMLVELGILTDALLAVGIMVIAVYHIHREYDAIDTDILSELKD